MQTSEQHPTSPRRRGLLLPLLAAGLLGGAVAAGGVTLLDDDGGDARTVVQQAPLAQPAASAEAGTGAEDGLTPREIYRRYAPGVVFVRAQVPGQAQSPFDLSPPSSEATGSGFVVNDDGEILTNAHVVHGARDVVVQFADNKTAKAKVVGTDVSTDVALLKVDPEGLDLTPLPLGSSARVAVGDPTIAIGNPFGLDRTLTTGVVSALQRRIPAPNNVAITDVIQTDAAINPGNSGGPLIDATGKVIGINSQIATGGGSNGSVGIGFAVPIDTVKRILPELEKTGRVERAYLGVSGLTIDGSLDGLDLPVDKGVLIQEVEPGSPADRAGLRAGRFQGQLDGETIVLGGDIITEVDGKAIARQEDLVRLVQGKDAGEEIKLTVVREGDERELEVKLARRPNEVQQP